MEERDDRLKFELRGEERRSVLLLEELDKALPWQVSFM
jgi:hypothetical protein